MELEAWYMACRLYFQYHDSISQAEPCCRLSDKVPLAPVVEGGGDFETFVPETQIGQARRRWCDGTLTTSNSPPCRLLACHTRSIRGFCRLTK